MKASSDNNVIHLSSVWICFHLSAQGTPGLPVELFVCDGPSDMSFPTLHKSFPRASTIETIIDSLRPITKHLEVSDVAFGPQIAELVGNQRNEYMEQIQLVQTPWDANEEDFPDGCAVVPQRNWNCGMEYLRAKLQRCPSESTSNIFIFIALRTPMVFSANVRNHSWRQFELHRNQGVRCLHLFCTRQLSNCMPFEQLPSLCI